MKYIFILPCFFLIKPAVAQLTYQTTFKLKKVSTTTQLISTVDGGTTIVGYTNTPSDYCEDHSYCNSTAFAYHFDNKGILKWNKTYFPDLAYSRVRAANTRDGGFVLFGRLYDTVTRQAKGGLLIKCNNNGGVEWSKQILSKNYIFFQPQIIQQDEQGNFLLVNLINYEGTVQIIKLNDAGDVLWNTAITLAFFGDLFTVTTFLQKGNKYYISGYQTCEECEPKLQTAYTIVINTTGNILSLKKIRTKNNINYYISATVQKLFVRNRVLYAYGYCDNKTFILPLTDTITSATASVIAPGIFSLQHYLKKFKNVFPFQFDAYTYFEANTSIKDGYYNSLDHYDTMNRICPDFIKPEIDTSTSERLFFIEAFKQINPLTDSIYSQDKKVTVLSDSISSKSICRGEALEKNQNNISGINSSASKEISVFPNPANKIIHVNKAKSNHATIEIFSSLGMREKLITTNLRATVIDVSNLTNGMYFIRITDENNASYLSSFIKR